MSFLQNLFRRSNPQTKPKPAMFSPNQVEPPQVENTQSSKARDWDNDHTAIFFLHPQGILDYGGFFEGQVLIALRRALDSVSDTNVGSFQGAWDGQHLVAFHGDLFEKPSLGIGSGFDTLGDHWSFNNKYLDPILVSAIERCSTLGYDPYVVALHRLRLEHCIHMHQSLSRAVGAHYMGVLTTTSWRHNLSAYRYVMGEKVHLAGRLEIWGNRVVGPWLAGTTDLSLAGLQRG